MSDEFGPAGTNAVTVRPSLTPLLPRVGAAPPTWWRPCSSPLAKDGTVLTAEWANLISGNLRQVLGLAQIGGLVEGADYDAGEDFMLQKAIERIISRFNGADCRIVTGIVNAPPGTPTVGASWIIGTSPSGLFAGRANQIAQWTGARWSFVGPATGYLVIDTSQALDASGRWLRWSGTAWVTAVASAGAYGPALRSTQALVNAGQDAERFITADMLHRRSRITWQFGGSVTVPPDAYGLIPLTPASVVLGADIASGGNGFLVGAVDTGYYHVHARMRREAAADVTQMGLRLVRNGSTVIETRTSEIFATAQRLELIHTFTLNIAPGDVITAEAFQAGSSSTARTCTLSFVANRMSGY